MKTWNETGDALRLAADLTQAQDLRLTECSLGSRLLCRSLLINNDGQRWCNLHTLIINNYQHRIQGNFHPSFDLRLQSNLGARRSSFDNSGCEWQLSCALCLKISLWDTCGALRLLCKLNTPSISMSCPLSKGIPLRERNANLLSVLTLVTSARWRVSIGFRVFYESGRQNGKMNLSATRR